MAAESDRDEPSRVREYVTDRWVGVGGLALLVAGVGVLARSPGLVLSAAVGASYAGYARSADPPALAAAEASEAVGTDVDTRVGLRLERDVADQTPALGETVEVSVTLHNETGGFLPDVRIVDGVPPDLEVVEGSPRHGAALRPGRRVQYTYEVRATRGEHRFQPAQVTVADPGGAVERETALRTETTIRCRLALEAIEALPLRGSTTPATGRVETDVGGSGVEFHATREYRPGDPLNRIDWNRKAKLDELGTLEYREERSATVMLLVDVRRAAYRAPEPGGRTAVERSVDAAGRSFATLLDAGDRVGLASLGRPRERCWLAPGVGHDHRAQGRDYLATHPAFAATPPERELHGSLTEDRRRELQERLVDRLHARLPADAQVFLFSPCCDGYPSVVCRRLQAHGHPVTVISPDPTSADEAVHALARMERDDRLRHLRRRNVRVIDWPGDEALAAAVTRASGRWRP